MGCDMPYNEVKDAKDARDIVYTPSDIGAIGARYIRWRRDNKELAVPVGVGSIDEYFLPMLSGEMLSIIGRPGNGKTGFMMRWARHRARELVRMGELDRVVVYVTYEQHIEELHAFHVAAEQSISISDMARGKLSDEQIGKIDLAGVARTDMPLWFIGHSMERRKKRPKITASALAMALMAIEEWDNQRFTIDMVFIDYLQRIPFEGDVESKVIGVSDNLDRLKDGALAFSCPFVVGVQAKRSVDEKAVQIPSMDDGQWTSNIEQSSDKVMSVVRPRHYKKEGEQFGSMVVEGSCQMLVSVLKQKMGADNKAFWVYFDPAYNKLDELELERAEGSKDINDTFREYWS